jgi:demethylmenaquinone methyltransferase/2-methoxy-6-polyprenyl-1,4-benzoquinol methylase
LQDVRTGTDRVLPSCAVEERLARRPQAIRAMFAAVASRYDLLNRMLSLRQDVRWRRRLAGAVAGAPAGPVLDLATGTGDVALALDGRAVVGADFCIDMLALARPKARRVRRSLPLAVADALALPFAPATFAAVTIAFGIRNFADLDTALEELHRVLVAGGVLALLEFQRPRRAVVALALRLWNRVVVTPVGRMVSADREAYAYLPASVETFPDSEALARRAAAHGFELLERDDLSGGIAALTVVRRQEDE